MNKVVAVVLWLSLGTLPLFAQNGDTEKLQGTWEITALIDDGVVIPDEQIKKRFALNGRFTVSGQAITLTDPDKFQSKTLLFVSDAKASPKTLDLAGSQKTTGKGIYLLADDVLLICIGEPEAKQRPTTFSAPKGSALMLMTLRRVKDTETKPPVGVSPPPPTPPTPPMPPMPPAVQPVPKDGKLRDALVGTWGHQDDDWVHLVTFNSDGTYSGTRTYKHVIGRFFNPDVRSSGTWKVQDNVILLTCTASTDRELINQVSSYRIRSLTATEVISVDQFGKMRRDWKSR